jgi:hypothetical protein
MSNNNIHLHASKDSAFSPYVKDPVSGLMVKSIQAQVKIPMIEVFQGWNRLQSQTALSNNISNQQIDFKIGGNFSNGLLSELWLQIQLRENNTANARFNIYNLFNRIEIIDSNGKIYKTIYPDEMFVTEMMKRTLTEHQKRRNLEGLQADYTPDAITLTQNTSKTFYIKLPTNFDFLMTDLRYLSAPMTIRFFFKPVAEICYTGGGLGNDISLVSFNLLMNEIEHPMNNNVRGPLFHKILQFTRHTETLNIVSNTVYNIKLSSFHGYAPYIWFYIRPLPITNPANLLNFGVLSANNFLYELRNSQNNIIGINWNMTETKYLLQSNIDSDFLNQTNTWLGTIWHGLDPINATYGQHSGGMVFDGNQFLNFNSGSIAGGAYELIVYMAHFEHFIIEKNGHFTFSR